jgi:hypothetical protein
MNQQTFFEKIIATLEQFNISYMVTGSVGAMLFGIPRLTNDMDVVVEFKESHITDFLGSFPKDDFYFPPEDFIRQQILKRGKFNIIHTESGSKVDFILRKENDFSKSEFTNRKKIEFSKNVSAFSASPEDIILSKLRYYTLGKSEKHLKDIQGIMSISGHELDMNYLNQWIARLNLSEAWRYLNNLDGH